MDNLTITIPVGWAAQSSPKGTVSMDEPPQLTQQEVQIERWKPWKDSPYQISDMGRVRRMRQDGSYIIRKPRDDGKGHWRYNLTWERQGIPYREEPFIHQMVMELFGPPKPAGDHVVILHGRDDGHDNRLVNLSWGSREENVEEAYDDGHIQNQVQKQREQSANNSY